MNIVNSYTELEKRILATISYYDIFDYPLTANEIYSYLIKRNSSGDSDYENTLGDVMEALEKSEILSEKIRVRFGFYFLTGRENIMEKRLERKKIADQKWKKARRIFRLLEITPFLRGIFISGSLALGNSRDDSDVDLIVVAKWGRIWTVRTFITLLTSLFGARRHGKVTRDMICLNHYITHKSLRIPFESLYNAQSYIHLVNLYKKKADEEVFGKFQKENEWIGKYAENKITELGTHRSIKGNSVLSHISKIFEFILSGGAGDFLEKKFSEFQSARIKNDPLYKKPGGRIMISDKQLEFHPDSHEKFVIPEFNLRMEKLGLSEFTGQKDSGLNR